MMAAGPIFILMTYVTPKVSSLLEKPEELIFQVTKKSEAELVRISDEANEIAEESIMNVKTVQACNGQESIVGVSNVPRFLIFQK